MLRRTLISLIALFLFTFQQPVSGAVCVNRFLSHSEGVKQIVTLLTGKLTFQEAQDLARERSTVEWLDDNGKVVATCVDLKPLRPMPVGCDGKVSGVVMVATFMTTRRPAKVMVVKLGPSGAVQFQEQS